MILGKKTQYPHSYAPETLFSINRSEARAKINFSDEIPFHGIDIWNGWELTWLDKNKKPLIGIISIRIDAHSPQIIESKSLKLYLGSFAMTQYKSKADLETTIKKDIEKAIQYPVKTAIHIGANESKGKIRKLPGKCIDNLNIECNFRKVDPKLLSYNSEIITERIHSHLFRSLCPVTNQPDIGSIILSYEGRSIDHDSLLKYIISYRQHNDFHEACVERIFMDIKNICRPSKLTVFALFNRRGGIDINPFRSDYEKAPNDFRTWRQ